MNKQKIENFYEVQKIREDLIINDNFIPCHKKEIFLTFGKTKEEVKNNPEFIKNGIVYKTNGIELHKLFFPELDEEKMYKKIHGYSSEIGKYFEFLEQDLGLVDYECSHEPKIFDIEYQLKSDRQLTGSGYIDCGKINNNWIAQFSCRAGIDDYDIESFIFNRKPTIRMIERATKIMFWKLECMLYQKPIEELEYIFNQN